MDKDSIIRQVSFRCYGWIQKGVVGGSEGLDPLKKLQVVICFLRNTCMDPLLETIGLIASRVRFVRHTVKYVDD